MAKQTISYNILYMFRGNTRQPNVRSYLSHYFARTVKSSVYTPTPLAEPSPQSLCVIDRVGRLSGLNVISNRPF